MKLKNITLFLIIAVSVALASCGGSASPPAVPLTTTPNPIPAKPSPTPTFLPAPTVTPFPTGSGSEPVISEPPTEGEEQSPAEGEATAPTAEAQSPTQTPPPPPPPPGSNLPEGVVVGSKIFAADFYRGWPDYDDPTAKIYINEGQYVFEIGPIDARFITTTAVDHRDTYTQFEATPAQCPNNKEGGYGLLFRYVDSSNYYLLTLFCDNTFSVTARAGGSLVAGEFADGTLPAGVDITTPEVHVIGIKSKGDTHTIYVDGQEVASFTSDRHDQGDVALYAVNAGEGVTKVAFDNLEVWTAE